MNVERHCASASCGLFNYADGFRSTLISGARNSESLLRLDGKIIRDHIGPLTLAQYEDGAPQAILRPSVVSIPFPPVRSQMITEACLRVLLPLFKITIVSHIGP